MAYGDYDGPDKPHKGKEDGACNRTRCQDEPAIWYNHGSYSWYCAGCRTEIEEDPINKRDWANNFFPRLKHPMFETRAIMNERYAKERKEHDHPYIERYLKNPHLPNFCLKSNHWADPSKKGQAFGQLNAGDGLEVFGYDGKSIKTYETIDALLDEWMID